MPKVTRQYLEAKVASAQRAVDTLNKNQGGTTGKVRDEISAMIRKAEIALRDAKDDLKEFNSNPDNK
jgi:hypothetical protein